VTTLIGAGNATGLFPLIAPGMPVSGTLVGAGNVTGLFPEVTPAATPSPAPGTRPPAAGRGVSGADPAAPVADVRPSGTPVLTAQVLGLVALAIAVMLAITRLSVRRRGRGA
jgi:hypothetical protein